MGRPSCGQNCAQRNRRDRVSIGAFSWRWRASSMTAIDPLAQASPSYAYKASLIGAAHQFELTDRGLSWRLAGRSGTWPYADIAAVSLSYRPVSMQARRFRADLRHVSGVRLVILSTSWQTAALMAPQDQSYRVFITELHARMAKAGSRAVLVGGLVRRNRPLTYSFDRIPEALLP